MMRFCDLRQAQIGGRFAYYDTITDRFLDFNGNQTWDVFCEFLDDLHQTYGHGPKKSTLIERLKRITPQWATSSEIQQVETAPSAESRVTEPYHATGQPVPYKPADGWDKEGN